VEKRASRRGAGASVFRIVSVVKSRVPGGNGGVLIAVFSGSKPPGFIGFERAADGAAELFAIKRRSGKVAIESGGESLQVAIAFVVEKRAVIVVGAGFRDDVDDAAAGAAGFGGEAGGGDLKFLNGVLRKVGERAANDFVVVVAAVDGDVAAAADAAGRADFERVRLGGIEIRRGAIAGN
jgi:hypothetical protein